MNTRKDEYPKYSYNSGLCDEVGNPTFGEDLDHLFNEVENHKASDIAKEIFERLYQHIKFDGHTIGVWKNDLLCIAKEYGIDLE